MSYSYYNTRTPYEVQRDNGQKFNFAKIKERYDQTKPITGKKRGHLNIRPISDRDRSHERIVKISDTEYYLTYDAHCWTEINNGRKHQRAMTFSLNGDMETVTVHTPRTTWAQANPDNLYPRAFSSASTFYFYDFNLPVGLSMVNNNACKYVRVNYPDDYKYYTIEKGDITFTRRQGTEQWHPMVVHTEFVHTLDKEQTKALRKEAKPLLDYLKIMVDMVEPKYIGSWENALASATKNIPKDKVFKLVDGDAPSHWFELAEYYKKKVEDVSWAYDHRKTSTRTVTYHTNKISAKLNKDIYQLVKPFKQVAVPLGEMCKDNYKSWFK